MSKLILIGGAPGIGKTTLLERLPHEVRPCAILDADQVWRVFPFQLEDSMKPIVERSVIGVLRGYLEAGFPHVFLGWVLANPELIGRLLDGTRDRFDAFQILHLTATPEVLAERSREKYERGLIPEYQELKVRQIEALPYEKIDTSRLTPREVAGEVAARTVAS